MTTWNIFVKQTETKAEALLFGALSEAIMSSFKHDHQSYLLGPQEQNNTRLNTMYMGRYKQIC